MIQHNKTHFAFNKITALLGIVCCLLITSAKAATWYVDSTAAGSANGTSWSNAWTAVAQIAGVAAGDTVYFSGGPSGSSRTYNLNGNSWYMVSGSSASNRTTYKIGQDSQHNGTAIFSSSNGGTWFAGNNSVNTQNITVSGDAGDGQQHFKLSGYSQMANGASVSNWHISYVNCQNIGSVASFNPANGIEIDHCSATCNDMNGSTAITAAITGSTWDDSRFHDNTILVPRAGVGVGFGPGFGAKGFAAGGVGLSIYNNTITSYSAAYTGSQHQDGWQCEGNSSFLKFYNNRIRDFSNYGIYLEAHDGNFSNVSVSNNLIYISDPTLNNYYPQGIVAIVTSGTYQGVAPCVFQNVVIDGNTILDYVGHYSIGYGNPANVISASFSNCSIQNNTTINGLDSFIINANPTVQNNVLLTAAQAALKFVSYTPYAGASDDFTLAPTIIPVVISTQPAASQTVVSGATATFSAIVTGASSYQWQKNGVNISGSTGATLTLANVTSADAATYTLVASNATGSATSNNAVLTVNVPPVISAQPVNQTVISGSTGSFSVAASGSPSPTFQWRVNGVNIPGATSTTLTLTGVTPANAGTYTAVVTNSAGSATSVGAVLAVNVPPVITSQPTNQSLASGSTLSLSVIATGTPAPTFQWRFNGVNILSGTYAILTLSNVTSANAGTYTVIATNSAGSVTSSVAALTVTTPVVVTPPSVGGSSSVGVTTGGTGSVTTGGTTTGTGSTATTGTGTAAGIGSTTGTGSSQVAPSILIQPSSQTVKLSSKASFSVTASGVPSPSFQWRKNGVAIAGATNSNLTLASVQATDAGSYDVVVTNTAGSILSNYATLAIGTKKSHLSDVSLRSVAGTGSNTLIAGFAVSGSTTKSVMVRGIGPTLKSFGVSGVLDNPVLSLYSGSTLLSSNESWSTTTDATRIASTSNSVGAFSLPNSSNDAALLSSLDSGSYTAAVSGKAGTTGVALIEVYDADPTADSNIVAVSARTQVGSGDNVMIVGIVVDGDTPKQLLIRAVGPTLTNFGVNGVLADPQLSLFQGSTLLQQNDNWGGTSTLSTAFAQAGTFALDPNSKDAAILVTVQPGSYSAIVCGVNNTTGVALVEVYEMP